MVKPAAPKARRTTAKGNLHSISHEGLTRNNTTPSAGLRNMTMFASNRMPGIHKCRVSLVYKTQCGRSQVELLVFLMTSLDLPLKKGFFTISVWQAHLLPGFQIKER